MATEPREALTKADIVNALRELVDGYELKTEKEKERRIERVANFIVREMLEQKGDGFLMAKEMLEYFTERQLRWDR